MLPYSPIICPALRDVGQRLECGTGMKSVIGFAGLLAGALMLTGALGNALQDRAASRHPLSSRYVPEAEATTDSWGWRRTPKTPEAQPTAEPPRRAPPASPANQS